MNQRPLVSICIPTFNGVRHLASTLASIESQDYPNIEVSICDDASQDSTFSVLESWRRQVPLPVSLTRNDSNQGPGSAFAKAVDQSNGTYIVVFSHDDQMGPKHVSELVAEMQSDPSLAVVPAHGEGFGIAQQFPSSASPARAWRFFLGLLETNLVFAPGTLVARQLWDPTYLGVANFACQDWEMWLNLSLQGGFGKPSGSVHYNIHESNLHTMHGELARQLDVGLMFRRVLDGELLRSRLQVLSPQVQRLLLRQIRIFFMSGSVAMPLVRALNVDLLDNGDRFLEGLPHWTRYSWAADRVMNEYVDGSSWTVQTRSVVLEEIEEIFSKHQDIEKGSSVASVNRCTENDLSLPDMERRLLEGTTRKLISLRVRSLLSTRIFWRPRAVILKVSRRLLLWRLRSYPWVDPT